MNKRIKMGPVLIIGALVLLVGMAIILTPAPPTEEEPTATAHKEAEKPKEAVKLDIPKLEQDMASGNPHLMDDATESISRGYLTARGKQREDLVKMVWRLVETADREITRTNAVDLARGFEGADPARFLRVVKNDRSPMVKRVALISLASFPYDHAVEKTLQSFTKDPDPGLRATAVISWVAYLMSSGRAADKQLAELLGVYDNDMSAKSAMAMSQRGAEVLPAVTQVLYTSKKGPQRHGAALVIAMVCAGFNPNIEAFAKAAQVTHRIDAGHRRSNPAGVKPLIWALTNDPYAPTREIAAQGLGYLGSEEAVRPLARALSDQDKYVRRRSAAALVTLPAQAAIPELSACATGDTDAETRRFAVEALGGIADPAIVPAVVQATRDKSPIVRRYAATELGKLKDETAMDALMALLGKPSDPDADVRWAAVMALGHMQDKRAEKVLVGALSDVSPQVQNSAERALQRMGVARREEAGFRS